MLLRSIWIPPGLILLVFITLLSGLAGIAQELDTVGLFLKSEIGIVLSAVYACAFLRYMRFDAVECFRRYAWVAFGVAVLGLLLYPVLAILIEKYRLESIEYEPGEFCIVTLPAIYYFADQWQRHRKGGAQVLLMILAVALSGSSMGFLGLFVGLYLFGRRYRFGSVVAPAVILALGFAVYTVSADFQRRVSDSFTGFTLLDAADLNDSSFSQLSGAYVSANALLRHPLLGEGMGAISQVNDRYIGTLRGIEFLPEGVLGIARGDGGSMLFRLAGETGLTGLVLAFGFLWYCYPRKGSVDRKQTASALLVYVFLKLLRSGVYFNPEVMFLLVIYGANGSHVLHAAEESKRKVEQDAVAGEGGNGLMLPQGSHAR